MTRVRISSILFENIRTCHNARDDATKYQTNVKKMKKMKKMFVSEFDQRRKTVETIQKIAGERRVV